MHQRHVAGSSWDPNRYAAFSDHRLRPALELLERVPLAAPQVIYDLGCGTGEITRLMAERWPDAAIIGVDNSPEMLAKARSQPSSVTWIEADIADWRPDATPDLIYSNATLQWLDDHDALFPRLVGLLAPGGCLAAQMPQSWPLPSHRLMRETLAHGGPNGTPIGPPALRQALDHVWVADASHYFDLLSPLSQSIDIWETEYLQILTGENPVLEWVSGTGLRPVLNGLAPEDRAAFLSSYSVRLLDAYPRRANGQTLYPFRRLFIIATKSAP
jgi:trans-aconitate 2-methyltransferase